MSLYRHRGAAHSACNLNNSIPKEINVSFHNGSNYDYDFIIKELAEEFKEQFTCLGENIEKNITFSAPIEKNAKKLIKIEKKLEICILRITIYSQRKIYSKLIMQFSW